MKAPYEPEIHHRPFDSAQGRRSIRLKGCDYSQAGAYFITIVTQNRLSLFGEVVGAEMQMNDYGNIVVDSCQWLARQYSYIELGAWIVMPNHFHAILVINDDSGRGGSRTAPTEV